MRRMGSEEKFLEWTMAIITEIMAFRIFRIFRILG